MCGITGFVGFEDINLLKDMTQTLQHRGPDEKAHYISKTCSLGHRRLITIDPTKGLYPIHNENNDIFVIHNGDIYNYKELNKELEAKGHRFYSNCDGETVVHAYEEWGVDCFSKFNGMFAIAIWDDIKKKLILARDKAGIKPVNYAVIDGNFVFASEVKSILLHPNFKKKIDRKALHQFLNVRYVPGNRTMFDGINELPAASYLVFDGKINITKYWNLQITEQQNSEQYFVEKIQNTIKSAVERHMIADVPISVLLSGGIDSSIVTAYASQVAEKPLTTICMGFDSETEMFKNEFEDAQVVADHFGTNHKNITMKFDLIQRMPEMIWHMDMPKRNSYPYFVYEKLKDCTTVVLSGMGGDELFAGYEFRYKTMNKIESLRKTIQNYEVAKQTSQDLIAKQNKSMELEQDTELDKAKQTRDLFEDTKIYLLYNSLDRVNDTDYWNSKVYETEMLQNFDELHPHYTTYFDKQNSLINNTLVTDFKEKMKNDFLNIDDRMSMANSLMSRVPFLDSEIIDLAFSIPSELKFSGGKGKYILKKAVKDVIPAHCFEKRKQGFASDTYSVYKNELKDACETYLLNGNVVKKGYLRKDYIQNVLNKPLSQTMTRHYNNLWNMLSFEVWFNQFIENENINNAFQSLDEMH